jgi:hypothetical protein
MTFDRKRLVKKQSQPMKTIFTSNGKENEREKPKTKPPFHERMGIWGYTITTLALGFGIGALFGAFAYSLTATTDEKLIEDNKYYKEQSRLAKNESDSLKHENGLLLSEKESLQQKTNEKQDEIKKLNISLSKVQTEITQYKEKEQSNNKDSVNSNSIGDNSSKEVDKENLSSSPTEVPLNESVSFFDGKISVAVFGISSTNADIQIGADGYDSLKFYSKEAGSQLNYDGETKYQVRVIKIDYYKNKIVVQVTKI